jgi:hypothetical protein
MIRELAPRLRRRLDRVEAPRSRLGWVFAGLAALTAATPPVAALLGRFGAREALRVLREHLGGG